MSTPQSTINICKGVKLNNRYEHTIYFANSTAQATYFSGKVVKSFTAYSFIRKHWPLKVGATLEEAQSWSYLYFKNTSNGKVYYYFINNIEYINDGTVELSLELDVMQTYMFDYQLLNSFVEREHVADDTVGKHLVDEGLETGELQVIASNNVNFTDMCILAMCTYNPINTTEDFTDTHFAGKYNNVFYGLGVYGINLSSWQAWGAKIKLLDDYGKSDGIVAMWMYPKELVELDTNESWTDGGVTHQVKGSDNIITDRIGRNTVLGGAYTPRNNKLLTYPYNFLYVHNNSGSAGTFRYEEFGDPGYIYFEVVGTVSPDGAVAIYPINYKGEQNNFEHAITLSNFPTCAWNQDVYKLWLAQNQNQQKLALAGAGITIAGGAVATVASAVTGNVVGATAGVGAMIGGASQVANLMAQKADMAVQPPQAKGAHSSSVNTANGFQTFTIQKKAIRKDFAERLDAYFDMYGYKVNAVKTPNRAVRENWTYTKTVGCHIKGDLCNEDATKIESIYDQGITFWKNGDSIGNYGLSNKTV